MNVKRGNLMKTRENQKGFSLIELMMVVVIIGVLAGVGIPQYQKFQMKAKQSEVKTLLSSMYTSQKAFFAEWNQYYADFNAVGYGLDGNLGYYVGFSAAGIAGPATHPNTAYNNAAAPVFNAALFCTNASVNTTCDVSKARTTVLPTAVTDATGLFTFAGSSNLDSDSTIDQWTINQNKVFAQNPLFDDIAN